MKKKTNEYKIENMQRYKNTKIKNYEKKHRKGKTLIPRICKCISGKACGATMTTTAMSCVTPRFKTQIVHIFKGHQFHPTTNSVFQSSACMSSY